MRTDSEKKTPPFKITIGQDELRSCKLLCTPKFTDRINPLEIKQILKSPKPQLEISENSGKMASLENQGCL